MRTKSIMRKLKVGDVLTKARIPIIIDDETEYRQVTVRLKHQGVCLRGYKAGKEIGTKNQSIVCSGQFILSKIDARNGAFGIIPDELDGAIITNDFLTYDVNEKELNIELFRLLTSQATFDELCTKASTGTTNRKRLNEKMFLNQELTLPPIDEQDTFIAHFKKLRSAQEMTLSELQTQTDLITKLRRSILNDAVSGRLVPQDPADEPANVLLERIKVEKAQLVKEGKIKKQKQLPPISEDETPYELPERWVWCRLGNIIVNMDSGWSPKCLEEPSDSDTWGVLKTTAVQSLNYLEYENKTLPVTLHARPEYEVQIGDILITRAGPKNRVGICCLVKTTSPKLMISDKIIRFHSYSEIFPAFLELSLNCGASNEFIESKKSGMAESQVNISQGNLELTPVPIPPLAEQHRIVAKIEKLMATCDALEAEVKKSRTETDRLIQIVLKEAFEENDCEELQWKLFVADVSDGLCTGVRYFPSHEFAQCDWGGRNLINAFDGYSRLSQYLTCCKDSPQEFLLSHYHADHYKGLVKASRLSAKKRQALNWEPDVIYLPGMPKVQKREEFYLALFTLNMYTLGDKTGSMELDLFNLIRKMRTKSPTFTYRFLYKGDKFKLSGEEHIALWPPRKITDDDLSDSIADTIDKFNRLKEENTDLKNIYDRIKSSNIVEDLIKNVSQEHEKIHELSDFIEKDDGVYMEENFDIPQNNSAEINELNDQLRDVANHLSLAFYKVEDLLFMGDVSPQVIPNIVKQLQNSKHTTFNTIIAPHHGTYWDKSLLALTACNVLVSAGSKLSKGLQKQWYQVGKNVLSTHAKGDIRL